MRSTVTLHGWRDRAPNVVSVAPTLRAGALLGGSYRLLHRLGGGGMGELFLAAHERLPLKLVVKTLDPTLISDQALLRFRQEAFILAQLQHPSIVQLIDFNWTEFGLPYLVMEYLPGRDLAAVLAARHTIDSARSWALLQQVASGLNAAHQRGITHGDIKPKNLMVIPGGAQHDVIKIIDFGVSMGSGSHLADLANGWPRPATPSAQAAPRPEPSTGARVSVAGTLEFMAPEQAEGRTNEVGPASDQFALAVVAYLLLAGHPPWRGGSPAEILEQVIKAPPQPLPARLATVESVLMTSLAKDPRQRHPSIMAFADALRSAMVTDRLLTVPETALARRAVTSPSPAGQTDAPPALSPAVPSGNGPPLPEPSASDYAASLALARATTLRLPRRVRARRWAPIIIGASLGTALGIVGPARAGHDLAYLWARLPGELSRAAGVVLAEGRHVLAYLPSGARAK